MTRRPLASGTLAALLLLGCQQPSEGGDAKRTPRPPPREDDTIPSALVIRVTIDGREANSIDAAMLAARKPDFEDGALRAWRLSSLVGAPAERPGAKLAVSGSHGPEVVMRAEPDLVPVLLLSRRKELVATMIDPKAPFPEYHGRGGRLGRRGDPVPRVEKVEHVRVFIEP